MTIHYAFEKKEDGSYTLISKLSFESKNDLLLFIKYIKRLKETGDCIA